MMLTLVCAGRESGRGMGHYYRAEALSAAWRGPTVIYERLRDGQFTSGPLPVVYDVPYDWFTPKDAIRITEVGDVVFPNGERLSGLEYAIIRKEFREAEKPHARQGMVYHHSLATPGDMPTLAVKRPWEVMARADIVVTYPCMTMLEAMCMGCQVEILEPRNDGERELLRRLQSTPNATIDGLGAERVAQAILNYAGCPPGT